MFSVTKKIVNANTNFVYRFWKSYESNMNGCRFKKAFLAVVRRYLTPPPTSTNVERLFSYGGLLLKKNRASMLPEKVDKILFIRENLFLLAFQIDW